MAPSLIFAVNVSGAKTLYPHDVTPPAPPAGMAWMPVAINRTPGQYGLEKDLPPLDPADKGHFHPESAEFWLVFAGRIRYAFEGQQPFTASEGDIVYVPANTWHATRFVGAEPACRLSITEYVGNTLLLPPSR